MRHPELFGRDKEVSHLRTLLIESPQACISVVGGPGMGKRALVETALEGIRASWVDASKVPREDIREALVSWASSGVTTLAIDGLASWTSEEVTKLQEAAVDAQMHLIAVSTRPLGVPHESVIRVGPLSLEASAQMLSAAAARAGGEPLAPSECNAAAARLQGLPSALALAAPRLANLGLAYVREAWVAEGLRPSFDAWLTPLTAAEKRALRLLAQFRDGLGHADVEDALRINADTLHALVSSSFVRRDQERGRFQLFPWLREHALAHLASEPEHEEAVLLLFLTRSAQGGDARRAFASNEYENLLAMTEHPSPDVSVAALSKLRWAWLARLQFDVGIETATRVLASLEVDSERWVKALLIRAQLRYGTGDVRALEDALRARDAAALLGQQDLEGVACVYQALFGAISGALDALEGAADVHARFGAVLDLYHRARLSTARGFRAMRIRDAHSARRFFRAAAEDSLLDGDHWLSADAWAQCGWLAFACGEDKEARFALSEATRCERLAHQPQPHLNRAVLEAATLIAEGRPSEVEGVVATVFSFLSIRVAIHVDVLQALRGIARLLEGDAEGARQAFEDALQGCDQRPAANAYWRFWLSLALTSLGAKASAHDAFHAALEMSRAEAELNEETNAIAAIFGARVLGDTSAVVVGVDVATAVRLLRARLKAGQGNTESRLALFALGHEHVGTSRLRVSDDTTAFEFNALKVSLALGSPQRAVLRALVEAHHTAPGVTTAADELVSRAWPGESHVNDSGLNRLRVAISRLRKLGLGDLIVSRTGGYALAESLTIESLRTSEAMPVKSVRNAK